MKPVKAGLLAKAQYQAGQAARDRAIDRRTAARRFGEASHRVFYCSSCGAPVPDSGPGRLGHAQRARRPGCREAMGV